jgi:DNA internalization-related competence protein ComEC/Rec2
VTDDTAQGRALRPLWSMTGGAVAAAGAAWWVIVPGPPWVRAMLVLLGVSSLAAAIASMARNKDGTKALLWFAAGLALVGGRGLGAAADRLDWESLVAEPGTTLRARVVLTEGWNATRWGRGSRVRVIDAELKDGPIQLAKRCRIDVRGAARTDDLPAPGDVVDILALPMGGAAVPLLVVPSARLVRATGQRRLLPRLRERLALDLMAAAGTDAARIRTAELAAALALGRRDLIPVAQRDRWRRSGFAHLLAVSGLHVGIVGGSAWLAAALLGAGPRTARLVALIVIPTYAVLAGGSSSAVRAALMGVIYLGARFLGRAVLPMAAVLLAALVLLVADPGLIAEPGFQLTVVITAALIRWVPPLTAALRGPAWLAGAVAVPLVAQISAAPLVAWHFRSLIPGALIANLLALPLLAPAVLGSVLAAVVAPVWAGGAGFVLAALHLLGSLLELIGGTARWAEWIAPAIPIPAVVLLAVSGWLALQPGRRAVWGVSAWVGALLLLDLRLLIGASPVAPVIEVLPVSDGAAVLAASGPDAVLADAGRFPREAAVLAADAGHRRLRALLASHTDEDHIGGAVDVLRTLEVDRLVVPSWMASTEETVPLLRAARTARTRVVPVARGSVLSMGALRLEVVWPPARNSPREENERSLVARIDLGPGCSLITSDIGRTTERRLSSSTRLDCDVLVVPHHGSRGGTSGPLLDSAAPSIALVPAAPGNTHGHPHREVLDRLTAHGIVVRIPARNVAAGARWNGRRWQPFP